MTSGPSSEALRAREQAQALWMRLLDEQVSTEGPHSLSRFTTTHKPSIVDELAREMLAFAARAREEEREAAIHAICPHCRTGSDPLKPSRAPGVELDLHYKAAFPDEEWGCQATPIRSAAAIRQRGEG